MNPFVQGAKTSRIVLAILLVAAIVIGTLISHEASATTKVPEVREVAALSSGSRFVVDEPSVLVLPATSTQAAVKVSFTREQVRYLSIMHVNNLVYSYGDPKPAMEAFRIVARERGWTPKEIKSWEIAIANIMMGESGFCPNVIRGAKIDGLNPGCKILRDKRGRLLQGTHSDAGFGQLIGIHYRHTTPGTGWLCDQEKLCSKWQIIASPWNSMTSLVALIERSGVKGWCYNSRARSYHRIACNNPGMDV